MAIYLRNGEKYEYNENQDHFLQYIYSHRWTRSLLKIAVQPGITKLGGTYMNSPLSKIQIPSFIKNNHINMDDYIEKRYKSYNDFFTREIKENKRIFDDDPLSLCAPCDSKLTYYHIDKDTSILIKNTYYQLEDLLMSPTLAREYQNGICLVFRLTVDDYHHYHYIDDGTSDDIKIISGKFHTVNPIANDYYPIYKTNTRHYQVLHTKHFSDMIQMEVGALMVGKITNHYKESFKKGEEKGYFEFGGSTVILLIKDNTVTIDEDIIQHSLNNDEVKVQLGEKIGYALKSL